MFVVVMNILLSCFDGEIMFVMYFIDFDYLSKFVMCLFMGFGMVVGVGVYY